MAETTFILSETAKFLRGPVRRDLDKMFLRALGCPVQVRPGEIEWPKVSPRNLADVQTSLPKILSALGPEQSDPWDRPALLSGLFIHNCWRTCLDTEDGCYDLAAALLSYLMQNRTENALDVATAPVVCELLNTWLTPVEPWTALPSVGVVLQAMFGEAWCFFNLPEGIDFYAESAFTPDFKFGEWAHRSRPDFMSGIMPIHTAISACELPDMGY